MKTKRSASKRVLSPHNASRFDDRVIAILQEGGIGVIPSDTVYGIAGSALNPRTISRMYRLKRRAERKPFIILIASIADLGRFGIAPSREMKSFLEHAWPGRVSILIPCPLKKFAYLHRGKKCLAFRVPPRTALRNMLRKTGPLAAPSANISELPPVTTIGEAKRSFGTAVDFYVDGGTMEGAPSTLVGFDLRGRLFVLRKGSGRVPRMV